MVRHRRDARLVRVACRPSGTARTARARREQLKCIDQEQPNAKDQGRAILCFGRYRPGSREELSSSTIQGGSAKPDRVAPGARTILNNMGARGEPKADRVCRTMPFASAKAPAKGGEKIRKGLPREGHRIAV